MNMYVISPTMKNIPTTTFQPRRNFGVGFALEMIAPDNINPSTIESSMAGPVKLFYTKLYKFRFNTIR